MADAIAASIAADGQKAYTGNQPMGSNKLTGLGDGSARDDSINMGQVQDEAVNYAGTSGGTADAQTLTPSPAITAYAAGQRFWFIAGAALTNTGAMTIDISSVGTKNVKMPDGNDPPAGAVTATGLHEVRYDGTNLVLTLPFITDDGAKLLAAATAAAQRTVLGLGTMAVEASADYLNLSEAETITQSLTISVAAAGANLFLTRGSGARLDLLSGLSDAKIRTNTNHPLLFGANGSDLAKLFASGGFAVQSTPSDPGAGKINTDNGYEVGDVPHGLQRGGSLDLTSGTGGTITDLGSVTSPDFIEGYLEQVSTDGTDGVLVRVGAGSVDTSGYTSRSADIVNGGSPGVTTSTAGFLIRAQTDSDLISGVFTLRRVTGNIWVFSFVGENETGDVVVSAGRRALSGTLDRVAVAATGSDNFDSGTLQIAAMRAL